MNIIPQYQGHGGLGQPTEMWAVNYTLNLAQHELDELFSTILLSDSPVAQRYADAMQQYAKKVSFR